MTKAIKSPGRKTARRDKTWCQPFLAELARTSNVAASARKADIDASTVYKDRRSDPKFAREWFEALCEGYDNLELDMHHRLREGELEGGSKARAPQVRQRDRLPPARRAPHLGAAAARPQRLCLRGRNPRLDQRQARKDAPAPAGPAQAARGDRVQTRRSHPMASEADDARLAELLALEEKERQKELAKLSDREREEFRYHWDLWARRRQLPPDGAWSTWLICAGRGFGKTRGCRMGPRGRQARSGRAHRAGRRVADRSSRGDGRGRERHSRMLAAAPLPGVRTFVAAAAMDERGAGDALFGRRAGKLARAAAQPRSRGRRRRSSSSTRPTPGSTCCFTRRCRAKRAIRRPIPRTANAGSSACRRPVSGAGTRVSLAGRQAGS